MGPLQPPLLISAYSVRSEAPRPLKHQTTKHHHKKHASEICKVYVLINYHYIPVLESIIDTEFQQAWTRSNWGRSRVFKSCKESYRER